MTTTPRLGFELLTGAALEYANVNDSLLKADRLICLSIIDRDDTTPPGSPADGDAYIVKATGTGDWAGHDDEIAIYYNGWVFVTPVEGMTAWIEDENLFLIYNGSAWTSPAITNKTSEYLRNVGSTRDRWYAGWPHTAAALTTAILTKDRQYAVPFVEGRGGTLDRLAVWLSANGGTSAKLRLGIYDSISDTDLYPNNLVIDGGEIDVSSGAAVLKSASISQALDANRTYWLSLLCGNTAGAAPTIRCLAAVGEVVNPILGLDNTLNNPGFGWYVAQTYGALPATFSTTSPTAITGAPIPLIGVRYSS